MTKMNYMLGDIVDVYDKDHKNPERMKLKSLPGLTESEYKVEPVEVYPDILLFNGFEKFGFADIYGWYDGEGRDINIEVNFTRNEFIVRGPNRKVEVRDDFYLHELQHAIDICNVDKNIEIINK